VNKPISRLHDETSSCLLILVTITIAFSGALTCCSRRIRLLGAGKGSQYADFRPSLAVLKKKTVYLSSEDNYTVYFHDSFTV